MHVVAAPVSLLPTPLTTTRDLYSVLHKDVNAGGLVEALRAIVESSAANARVHLLFL